MNAKGFTLIELLIVIGIIAILATVVILTLNPAELLRQSRDTTRFSDLSTVNSAIALYLSDVAAASIGTSTTASAPQGGSCYTSLPTSTGSYDGVGITLTTCAGRFPAANILNQVNIRATTSRLVDSTGWLPINFNNISTGSPLPNLPADPVSPNSFGTNTTSTDDFYYAYGVGPNNTYEINTRIESIKFASSSVNDGGNSWWLYEVGTNPGLGL